LCARQGALKSPAFSAGAAEMKALDKGGRLRYEFSHATKGGYRQTQVGCDIIIFNLTNGGEIEDEAFE